MYKKILVPLDGSARAEEILPHVEEMASKYRSTVLLLRAMEITVKIEGAEFMPLAGGAEMMNRAMEEERKAAATYLEGVQVRLQAKGIATQTRLVYGPVVEALIMAAGQEKVDLIAMASHGRTGAARVFYGSVASGVLHRVDRPLLIVRSRKAD
jgi:nucleotide-binding universal stress UspA family protein